jgi:hypothetical protein
VVTLSAVEGPLASEQATVPEQQGDRGDNLVQSWLVRQYVGHG